MAFLASFYLSGCALLGVGPTVSGPIQVPSQVHLAGIPFFSQSANQCGPVSLAMVLAWSGLTITPDELTPQVYAPQRKGSLQSSIIAAARRRERLAYVIKGKECLFKEVAAGHPVIVLQNLGLSWIPRWHYAVVVGYDFEGQDFIIHSGRIENRRVGMPTFLRTWRRADNWGLVVLPIKYLPACIEEIAYLKAALGLQQTGAVTAAIAAFKNAEMRWPMSPQTHLSLGNALYTSGDLSGAVEAFRKAAEIDPLNGTALNNLAHVLAELGMIDQAETAARRAVATDGPNQDLFRETLEDILHRRQ